MSRDVYLSENNLFGEFLYQVMVDGNNYDQFFSSKPLTWTEQWDIAFSYKEALDNY